MRPNRRSHIPAIISVIASLLTLTVAFMWFGSSIGGNINSINVSYLSENTSVLAAVFKASFDEQLALLTSEGANFEGVTFSDKDELRKTAETLIVTGTFTTVGALNSVGDAFDCSGASYSEKLPEGFTDSALTGYTLMFSDSRYFMGAPVKQGGKVAGALFGVGSRENIALLLSSTGSAISRACLLVDKDGNVIVLSDNAPYDVQKISNIFTDTDVSHPAKGTVSISEYRFGVIESTVAVAPVGLFGTYISEIVPNSAFRQQMSLMRADTMILVLLVVFAFLIIAISIMYLARSNSDILRSNERFKLVTVEAQDLVFDYDYKKQQLTLDGSTDNIIDNKDGKNIFSRTETLALIERVHEEDKEVRRIVEDLAVTDYTSVRGEFRFCCTDGTYRWFRIKGTVVRGHDGAPTRFIGSLVNADDIMNREALINAGIDKDPITGIYSKSAFYNNVTAMLRSASDSDLFAIYIIDIDNFRTVNDDLGHTTGDQVLADVAKKLCIVFSERDFVGRIGGDEFAAFLQLSAKARNVGMNIIESKARAICEQIRGSYTSKNKQVSISASVGVSIYPYSGRDYNTLFRSAGKALSHVKDGSKDGYEVYSSEDEKTEKE